MNGKDSSQINLSRVAGDAAILSGKKRVSGAKTMPQSPLRRDFEAKVGNEMPDGTIYAGTSPDTGKPLYVTPKDAEGRHTFKLAAQYAQTLSEHGRTDWRVPTEKELAVLCENRNRGKLKGTFNDGTFNENLSRNDRSCYWSSSAHYFVKAGAQLFSNGFKFSSYKNNYWSLRCVR